jgi:hypothetical protein
LTHIHLALENDRSQPEKEFSLLRDQRTKRNGTPLKTKTLAVILAVIGALAGPAAAQTIYTVNVDPTKTANTCVGSGSSSSTTFSCATLNTNLNSYSQWVWGLWVPDRNGSGGATTLNINSMGAKTVTRADGATNPTSSDIVQNQPVTIAYDGTNIRIIEQNTNLTVAGPYCTVGGTIYLCNDGTAATKPSTSGFSYLAALNNSIAASTGANGDLILTSPTGSTTGAFGKSASSSIDMEFSVDQSTIQSTGGAPALNVANAGPYVCDSTNGNIFFFRFQYGTSSPYTPYLNVSTYADASCTASSLTANTGWTYGISGIVPKNIHLKIAQVSSNIVFYYYPGNGSSPIQFASYSGTISQAGIVAGASALVTVTHLNIQ